MVWCSPTLVVLLLTVATFFFCLRVATTRPVLGALTRFVPGFSLWRIPTIYAYGYGFCLALVAALGLDRILAERRGSGARQWVTLAAVAIIGVMVVIDMVVIRPDMKAHYPRWQHLALLLSGLGLFAISRAVSCELGVRSSDG